MTICANCKHFINKEPGTPRSNVWYNHLCGAVELPTKIDPVDGQEKHYSKNDLDQEHFTDNTHQYCRKINDGHCRHFDPLATKTTVTDPALN